MITSPPIPCTSPTFVELSLRYNSSNPSSKLKKPHDPNHRNQSVTSIGQSRIFSYSSNVATKLILSSKKTSPALATRSKSFSKPLMIYNPVNLRISSPLAEQSVNSGKKGRKRYAWNANWKAGRVFESTKTATRSDQVVLGEQVVNGVMKHLGCEAQTRWEVGLWFLSGKVVSVGRRV